jgi:hypothetical protein
MYSDFHVLIIEPNNLLKTPYFYLPKSYNITRVSSVSSSNTILQRITPDLVIISASLGPAETLHIFDTLHKHIYKRIPGILIMVDLKNPLSFIIGTSWDGKIAIIDSLISSQDFFSMLSRVI